MLLSMFWIISISSLTTGGGDIVLAYRRPFSGRFICDLSWTVVILLIIGDFEAIFGGILGEGGGERANSPEVRYCEDQEMGESICWWIGGGFS